MDSISELKQIDLLSYIESATGNRAVKAGLNTYKFKKCPICHGGDHFTINTKENYYNTWNNCGAGSIIDFYMCFYRKNQKESIEALCEEFNIKSTGGEKVNTSKKKNEVKTIPIQSAKTTKEIDLTSLVNDYYTSDDNDLRYFVLERFVYSDDVLNKYKFAKADPVYFLKDYPELLPKLNNISAYEYILPIWKNEKVVNLILRRNDKKSTENNKTLNLKGLGVEIFNMEYIKASQKQFIFVCEGVFDCLSIECTGQKSISLNSVNMANKLIESIRLEDNAKNHIYVLCPDNDDAGAQLKEKLKAAFLEMNIRFLEMDIPQNYKDVNEYCKNDWKGFEESVKKVLNKSYVDSVHYFLENNFYSESEKYISYKSKKTGFENLDKNLDGVSPGLYIFGAESSLGKTTFLHQIADYMARKGDSVLYFSLEQSKMELISKSLSRIAYLELGEKVSSKHIIYNTDRELTAEVISEYKKYAENIFVHEGNFNSNVVDIKNKIQDYISLTGKSPIVFIDYLQVMQSVDMRMGDKQKTDTNITELKRISRDLFIPVFVISSLNRGNYLVPVNYESFKESGSIEFTADVLIGLQYSAINQIQDVKKVSEQRTLMTNAKLEIPRQIELICLKNRGGKQIFKQHYNYYPVYNYFEESEEAQAELKVDLFSGGISSLL